MGYSERENEADKVFRKNKKFDKRMKKLLNCPVS
jgi:hypothetical protein